MGMADVSAWLGANEWAIFSFAIWALLSLAPRPHPDKLTGPARIFWLVVDRLAVLTAEKTPGTWKMLFTPSPLTGLALESVEAPAAAVAVDRPPSPPEEKAKGP